MSDEKRLELLRKELKDKGYSSRKIGVRHRYCGYSSSIHVTIKDLNIDKKEIEAIAKKYSAVDYDERTGEILAGGNTFVFVDYDWNLKYASQKGDKKMAAVKEKVNKYGVSATDTPFFI